MRSSYDSVHNAYESPSQTKFQHEEGIGHNVPSLAKAISATVSCWERKDIQSKNICATQIGLDKMGV